MVGRGDRDMSSHPSGNRANNFALAAQRLDGAWACPRIDQYTHHLGRCFLFRSYADRTGAELARQGPHGKAAAVQYRELPNPQKTETGISPEEAILINDHFDCGTDEF